MEYVMLMDGDKMQHSLNTSSLSEGIHTLAIVGVSEDGTQIKLPSVQINVYKELTPIGCLDYPVKNQSISGILKILGWFLDNTGVSKIDVLIDSKVVGQAIYGASRSDVFVAYPKYNNKNSGFYFNLDTKSLSSGNHTISIRETGAMGLETIIGNRTIVVSN